jgi:hypothetical protein
MSHYERRNTAGTNTCPLCDGVSVISVIEPHPTHKGQEIHTFNCKECGDVKSEIVVIQHHENASVTPPPSTSVISLAPRILSATRAAIGGVTRTMSRMARRVSL